MADKKFGAYPNDATPEDGGKLLFENAAGTNSYNTTYTQLKTEVIDAMPLTGYTSGAGVISAADSIRGAIEKLNGNITAESIWDRTVTTIGPQNAGDDLAMGTGFVSADLFKLNDTDDSNLLSLVWNEDDSSDRTLNLLVNGAARSVSLSGDLTVSNSFTVGATNGGTLDFTGVSKTLNVEDDATVNQDLTTDATATFAGVNATTFDTNVAAAGVTLAGTTLQADGTDANIDVTVLPKGTGVITVTGTTNYEVNVTDDDDIPNKKFVDDAISTETAAYIVKSSQEIKVIAGVTEVTGKVYNTIANALTYTGTQSPTESNRFVIRFSGVNSESFTMQQWVHITGSAQGTDRLTGVITAPAVVAGEPLVTAIHACTVEGTIIAAGTNYVALVQCECSGGSGNAGATGVINIIDSLVDNGDWTNFAQLIISDSVISQEGGGTLALPGNVSIRDCQLQTVSLVGATITGGMSLPAATYGGGNYTIRNHSIGVAALTVGDGDTWTMVNTSGTGATTLTIAADGGSGGGTLTSYSISGFAITNNGTWNNYGDNYDNTASGLTATEVQAAIDELDTNDGVAIKNLVSKTFGDTPYAALATDHTILYDASGGASSVTLPATSGNTGQIYVIKKTDSSVNVVTIDPNASETIDGLTTKGLSSQYDFISVQSDGTNWHVIAAS